MFFRKKETNTDLKEESGAASQPLLQEDDLTVTMESNASLMSNNGVGVGSGLEQDDDESTSTPQGLTSRQPRQIPTLVFILVPMVLFFISSFLAAVFMPPSTNHEEGQPSSAPSSPPSPNSGRSKNSQPKQILGNKLHDDPVAPTLLSIRDENGGGLVNVRDNYLYRQLKHATFRQPEEQSTTLTSSIKPRAEIVMHSDKKDIGFGDALVLTWSHDDKTKNQVVNDDDIVALYCPAGERDPKRFHDAATIAQARTTHAHHDKSESKSRRRNNVWSIHSFPTVREESCEFRLYSHSVMDGASSFGRNENGRTLHQDLEHHYTFLAATGPISVTSNDIPTGIHISLTGKASEMNIQFATGDSGEPLVEVAKKSDRHAPIIKKRGLMQAQEDVTVSWTKVKGTSTTYVATDMCQEPATSTAPGFFAPPGYLHRVRATNLEPDTEYMYRVGLGFGQGIKWSEKYFVFTSSPLPGSGVALPSSGEPALVFLALADQGCHESKYGIALGADPPATPTPIVHPAQSVTQLITSLIDKQTIHSIHHIGDLSFADGAAHVWDVYMNMIQDYATRVPVMVGVGNHEYDHTQGGGDGKDPSGVLSAFGFQPHWGEGSFNATGGECGVPVSKRFVGPEGGNGVFWYSYDQSLVHTVMLSSEHNMTFGSSQYVWLEKNLAAVNRTITPWLVVEMHRPMYNSRLNWMDLMVSEGMQNEVEDLLYAYHVDLVLSGHYHSYFRSCDGLYSHKCDNGGPTYITVGTGGAPLDGNTTSLIPNHYTECFNREHFGVGRASVFNATSMHWEFVTVGGNVTDEVWLTRDHRGHR